MGLTNGMGPRVLHSACFSALGYFAFETVRLSILQEYLRRKELGERKTQVSVSTSWVCALVLYCFFFICVLNYSYFM